MDYNEATNEELDEYETMREEVEDEFGISVDDLGDDDVELLHDAI